MSTDTDTVREFLRHAEYFDSEDGSDRFVEALAALDRLAAAEAQRDALVRAIRDIETEALRDVDLSAYVRLLTFCATRARAALAAVAAEEKP